MLDLHSLAAIADRYPDAPPVRNFELDACRFEFDRRRYLMGVVNLSADSWYRESVCLCVDHALRRGQQLHLAGAAIVDVGAESTLPNAALVSPNDQRSMLRPVVTRLAEAGIPVSVETYHPEVANAVLNDGARVINLTGREGSREIFEAIASHGAGVIICFVAGDNVRDAGDLPDPTLIHGIQLEYFRDQVELATSAGVERIWLDPGLGFYYGNSQDGATRVAYQLQVFLQSFRLRELGWPICHALPHAFHLFREEVRSAEAFFAVMAAIGGTSLFRTHEVERVAPVLEAMQLNPPA
jgi:dihydropteroate synthase